MLVFIDESGCGGFKFIRGSSPYFVVAMVIFDSPEEATAASITIEGLREELGHKPLEFKFSSCSDAVRDGFIKGVLRHKFIVRAIVVNKQALYSVHLRSNKDSFYNYFVQLLLKHDGGVLRGANIQIDGSGDREFKRALNGYLRRELSGGKISKVTFSDSHRNKLVQLADMAAGAIARSYNGRERQNPDRWRTMLRPKIKDVWEFPR